MFVYLWVKSVSLLLVRYDPVEPHIVGLALNGSSFRRRETNFKPSLPYGICGLGKASGVNSEEKSELEYLRRPIVATFRQHVRHCLCQTVSATAAPLGPPLVWRGEPAAWATACSPCQSCPGLHTVEVTTASSHGVATTREAAY